MNKKSIAIAAIACALAAGCASQTPTERDFGESVRAVTRAQIHNMDAALYPQKEAVTGGHTGRLESVMEAHGGAVDDGSAVRQAISIGTGD